MPPDQWDIQIPSGWGAILAVSLAVALIFLSFIHWRRGRLGFRQVILEFLRLIVVCCLLLTLAKPERVERETLTRNPELVILKDDTGSMETSDIIQPDGNVISREAWLQAQVDRQFHLPLTDRYKVHQEKLSTYSQDPSDPRAPPGTNLNAALHAIQERYKQLRAVLILSDGDWNLGGSPMAAATRMRLQKSRLFCLAVGKDEFLPDLAVTDAKAPAFAIRGERVVIPFRIQSHLQQDVQLQVRLSSSLAGVQEKSVFLPAGQTTHESIMWQANRLGDHQLELSVPVQEGEYNTDNNQLKFRIAVREEVLQVLVIDSLPRWEYRFLRNALSRDPGVEVDCLLLHPGLERGGGADYIKTFPDGRDEISTYDCIFLGDVGLGDKELTKEHLALIRGVVEQQGSGLVFLPGMRGRHLSLLNSPVAEMLPVVLDQSKPEGISFTKESELSLTTSGSDHLLTMLADTGSAAGNKFLWRNLPGFYWNAAVIKAKPGADVLAVHRSLRNRWGRLPLLVTRPFGNGNVLFMGTDSAWRWRRGVEDTYHYRFWGQVVRWMAHPRHLSHEKGIRLFFTPENPQQNDKVFFQATVFEQSGFPVTKGTVTTTIRSPAGQLDRRQLTPVDGGWGVFKGSFVPRRPGTYRLDLECPEAGQSLSAQIEVSRDRLEKVGQPARYGSLRDISKLTRGSFAKNDELDRVVQEINLLPEDEDIVRRQPLWSAWWWGLIIVGLFSLYWVLRKKWGLI